MNSAQHYIAALDPEFHFDAAQETGAHGATISTLTDRSRHGRDAPLVVGRTAATVHRGEAAVGVCADFSDACYSVAFSLATTNAMTLVAVTSPQNVSGVVAAYSDGNWPTSDGMWLADRGDFATAYSLGLYGSDQAIPDRDLVGSGVMAAGWHVAGYQFDASRQPAYPPHRCRVFSNGAELAAATQVDNNSPGVPTFLGPLGNQTLRIGDGKDASWVKFQGSIAELILIASALSDADILALANALRDKWAF